MGIRFWLDGWQHFSDRGAVKSAYLVSALLVVCISLSSKVAAADQVLQQQALETMRKAGAYFQDEVAVQGGYVYFYSLDLSKRYGEGPATATQIWVQPPATPTVGMAFIAAWRATKDQAFLDAAASAAEALAYGQLESGGWTNSVDFDPQGSVALYRNGKGRGKNNSSLDDGQTQSAIRLMIRADAALGYANPTIHDAAISSLDALLAAQFPNGGFPQVWTGPVQPQAIVEASYPEYDWRSEGRIKEYWDHYTLNDDVCGYVTAALHDAYRAYRDDKYLDALKKLGDFLLLAQMPDPQPGWAQQYNYQMQPIWARKFEPAAMSGDESQEVIETLMQISTISGDKKYLQPIPAALRYLENSLLPDGRLARYYELKTNRPLYMERSGKGYELTYGDDNLPDHYGWKSESRLEELKAEFRRISTGAAQVSAAGEARKQEAAVRKIIDDLDDQGRWITVYEGEKLVGQTKFPNGTAYLSSEVFSRNMETLAGYVGTASAAGN